MITEDDLERIKLPDGIEFLHIAGQHIFSDTRLSPAGASIYLLRMGDKKNHPSIFDGGVLEFGFRELGNGWAILGIPIKSDETTIETLRTIEANIPTIEGK